jgi:hypothetical protein
MKKAQLGDGALAASLGVALFFAAALPYAIPGLVGHPPLQDYAEHLAAAAMASHPAEYPEYAFNGLFKTNAAFVVFVWAVGKAVGVERAGRAFLLLVLGVNAFALVRFVLHFGGRARMRVAALFAQPFVSNWFVSMGMLNFSLGVSLSLVALVALDRQLRAPSLARASAAAGVLLLTWYVHPVPVLVVGLLSLAELASQRAPGSALRDARALLLPLAPASLAVASSTVTHLHGTVRPAASGAATSFQTVPWLVYDLWAHWGHGFTLLSVTSLGLLAVLGTFGVGRMRAPVPFFGPLAFAGLVALYFGAPYQTVGLGYAGSRLLPYLWVAALVRVPERIGTPFAGVLAVLSGLYAGGMAVDAVRLSHDEDEFAAGVAAVAHGARLDVLSFSPRVTSKNTWSLSTAWGDYILGAGAHTWEMPGDTPSLPFRWRDPPPARLEPTAHRRFLDGVRTERAFCEARSAAGMDASDCGDAWRAEWAEYYRAVDPFVDALVLWDPPDDAVGRVPPVWAPAFHRGRLWIFERRASGQQAHLDVDAPRRAGASRQGEERGSDVAGEAASAQGEHLAVEPVVDVVARDARGDLDAGDRRRGGESARLEQGQGALDPSPERG